MELEDLQCCSVTELEDIFARVGPLSAPRGRFRGVHLGWFPRPRGQHPLVRPLLRAGFEWAPFGVDFDAQRWFFFASALKAGRFDCLAGPSRWRRGRVLQLHYERSRLPFFLRRHLYDEVTPLSDSLCLGMGGLNSPGRGGEEFFFALRRF